MAGYYEIRCTGRLRSQGLSPSTIANILDPLRVIFRRAICRDEVGIDPTENLDLPAIRGRRDRIEPPEVAPELLAALPDSEKAFWAVALFCGLRRGELRGAAKNKPESASTPTSPRLHRSRL